MRILISNDDGYFSPGIEALAEVAAGVRRSDRHRPRARSQRRVQLADARPAAVGAGGRQRLPLPERHPDRLRARRRHRAARSASPIWSCRASTTAPTWATTRSTRAPSPPRWKATCSACRRSRSRWPGAATSTSRLRRAWRATCCSVCVQRPLHRADAAQRQRAFVRCRRRCAACRSRASAGATWPSRWCARPVRAARPSTGSDRPAPPRRPGRAPTSTRSSRVGSRSHRCDIDLTAAALARRGTGLARAAVKRRHRASRQRSPAGPRMSRRPAWLAVPRGRCACAPARAAAQSRRPGPGVRRRARQHGRIAAPGRRSRPAGARRDGAGAATRVHRRGAGEPRLRGRRAADRTRPDDLQAEYRGADGRARDAGPVRRAPASAQVLEIGTGCGYQAAVLARVFGQVVSIERVRGLHEQARNNLRPMRLREPATGLRRRQSRRAAGRAVRRDRRWPPPARPSPTRCSSRCASVRD